MIPAQESIAIGELVVYPLVLIGVVFVLARHGLKREAGFFFLASFTLVRIIGAGFEIAAIKNPTQSNIIGATVLQSMGLSPLLMSSSALLKRIIDQTSTHVRSNSRNDGLDSILPRIPIVGLLYRMVGSNATATSRRSRVIQCIHIAATVSLVLFIVGATRETSDTSSKRSSGKTMIKVSLLLLVLIFAILFLLAAKSASEFNKIPTGEKRILIAILVAIPLLAVRILWAVLSVFTHISTFSSTHGSAAVRVCMAILEEFLIVVIYTFVGLTVPRYEASESARIEEQVPLGKQSPLAPNPQYPAHYAASNPQYPAQYAASYPAPHPTPEYSQR